jgi:hypothetical protein
MTDYRDPNFRDPMRPAMHDPNEVAGAQPWSNATWGWIAGIAIVVLVLAVMLSGGESTRTADQPANPPATIGQRTTPLAPPLSEAPTMNRPAPAPVTPAPAPVAPSPATPPAPQP